LVTRLAAEGAVAQAVPMIEIVPPVDLAALDAAVLALAAGEYAWVGFTSVNALAAVLDRTAHLDISPAVPADTRVAAVGPTTAAALRAAGIPVDLVPENGGSAATLGAIWPAAHEGESVLLPQSEIASPALRDALHAKDYRVDAVIAYRTLPKTLPETVTADLASGAFDAVLLTSPSTARALACTGLADGTVLGAIGDSTARAATDVGLPIAFIATAPTDSALIAGLSQFAAHHRKTPRP
jgi:uroporphyrinogen-III synthase